MDAIPTYQQIKDALALLEEYHDSTLDYEMVLRENQELKVASGNHLLYEKIEEWKRKERVLRWKCHRLEQENEVLKEKLKHHVDWRERAKMEEKEEEEEGCSVCPNCENTYTEGQIESGEVVPCNRCYKCFVGDCGSTACECEFSDDE